MVQFNDSQIAWIESTPIFPETIELKGIYGGNAFSYRICGRDKNGAISGLKETAGKKGFVLKVLDSSFSEDEEDALYYALKLCLPEEYSDREKLKKEYKQSQRLSDQSNRFATPIAIGELPNTFGFPGCDKFVCIVSKWVDGITLQSFLEKYASSITVSQVIEISKQLLEALTHLEKVDLKHDDLHSKNILIRKNELEEDSLSVVIVDTGSLKLLSAKTEKSHDDKSKIIKHFTEMYNLAFLNRKEFCTFPNFFTKYRDIIHKLNDEDQTRQFPFGIENAIEEIKDLEDQKYTVKPKEKRFYPFDAISAEHLADDKILLNLFVDELPWIQQIISDKPAAVSGPRGCGKSTVFRYLSAKAQLSVGDSSKAKEKLLSIPFLGVYISCGTELQNNLIWIAREKRVVEKSLEIETFFQLTLLRELFDSLALLVSANFHEEIYGISRKNIDEAIKLCNVTLADKASIPRFSNQSKISNTRDSIDYYISLLKLSMIRNENRGLLVPTTFLSSIAKSLKSRQSVYPITFLLDDYTDQRLGEGIQRILNKIIWLREGGLKFKISSEKFGFHESDIDGIPIQEHREFDYIDTGYTILSQKSTQRRKTLENIINKRLETANWTGRAKDFFGDEKYDDTKLARTLHSNSIESRDKAYKGLQTIANLWSGDISTVLHVLHLMFNKAGVTEVSKSKIQDNIQHDAIVSVSKANLERIKSFHPFGEEMNKIATTFASIATKLLKEGDFQKNGKPQRKIRLAYSTKFPDTFINDLSAADESNEKNAAKFVKELLRRTIFIELEKGSAKEGSDVSAVRWQLRPIYLPYKSAALLPDEYLDIKNIQEFLKMVLCPEEFYEMMVERYLRKGKSKGVRKKRSDNRTEDIFDSSDE